MWHNPAPWHACTQGRARDQSAKTNVQRTVYARKRQKLMQESPGTKEDPIYLSMFDWC